MPAKIGCYARVSTSDKQDTRSQRHVIRQWAIANHVRLADIRWYEDKQSGKTTEGREQLAKLMRAVDAGKVDTVVVFALKRLARNTQDGLRILADLGKRGIRVVSVSEQIDFSNSVGQLIATILLAVASFERSQIVERIRAGMAAAKAEGRAVGRPRDDKRLARIRSMRESMTVNQIAEKLEISRQAVYASLEKTAV